MEDCQGNKVETVSFIMTNVTSHVHPGSTRQFSLGIHLLFVELILHYVHALRSPSSIHSARET
jgi:hypothetical protein